MKVAKKLENMQNLLKYEQGTVNEGKELKKALNNSAIALKIEIFSPFPNLPTY